ncbi:50S ribosomal protein L11 methyltransferase [Nonomuraea dietziae]|uniref:50S ribosomal protein L11 methyltransferase n=1 Tax=Nonomuraea dietziae TaxID=65515 RepID=UPI0033DB2E1E
MDIERWAEIGGVLQTSDGVHRPSRFSAFLAAGMGDCGDLTVIDAGCGAGLVAVAALEAGARHVVAQDYDPKALHDTAHNVTRILGSRARARLTLWEADWSQLRPMKADLLAVNPPQRPAALLPAVPQNQRHLHDGGGPDGLAAIRLVVRHAGTGRVRTTAAAALRFDTREFPGWSAPRCVAMTELPYDPAWRALVPDLLGQVGIWELHRECADG